MTRRIFCSCMICSPFGTRNNRIPARDSRYPDALSDATDRREPYGFSSLLPFGIGMGSIHLQFWIQMDWVAGIVEESLLAPVLSGC